MKTKKYYRPGQHGYNMHNHEKMLFPGCDFRDLGHAIQSNHTLPKPAAPTIKDERTDDQKQTHVAAVVATDPGMSGWGNAPGGLSLAVWACAPGVDVAKVLQWVENRSDMTDEKEIDLNDWDAPAEASHVHIYTVNPGHPATI